MIRTYVALALALAIGAPAQAKTSGEVLADGVKVNPRVFSVATDPFPAHPVAFAGGVTGLPDLTYQILPGYRPGKLDLYLPPETFRGPRPVIVFIHGGGWMGGGNRYSGAFDNWPDVLAAMAARGYVVAAVSYRFSGEAPFPAAVQDVKAAIRWLRANAPRYRVDPARFVTFGGSAGGQLAALVATSCGAPALEPAAPTGGPARANVEHPVAGAADPAHASDCVNAAVAWYGVFGFRTMPVAPPLSAYLGCMDTACTEQQMLAASAVHYLDRNSPPMLLIAGSDDHTVPSRQTIDFHAAMQAAGVRSDMLIIPGVDHSFIGQTGDATRDASRLALGRTIDFIDAMIGDR